jgi:transcriptional regulator with XRE-family HTH domain
MFYITQKVIYLLFKIIINIKNNSEMVGNNLQKLRINNTKLSQKDIADYLNVDRNTVAAWENGKTDIKSEYIPKIAELLNIEIKDLFEKNLSIGKIGHTKNIGKDNSLLNGAIIIVTDKALLNDLMDKISNHINNNNINEN